MAIGMFVVPTWKLWMRRSRPSNEYPARTPTAMARKIQAVRYRSRKPRRRFAKTPTRRAAYSESRIASPLETVQAPGASSMLSAVTTPLSTIIA